MKPCIFLVVLALSVITLRAEATEGVARASRVTRQGSDDIELDICLVQVKVPKSVLAELLPTLLG
ncbi:hypothetical protein AVEN_86039-1 [Araneus ventricosus]|uniref:Uncharacterized protein n=1 Tax=Araneus ventricosus TaxID=182803 RepID=A0A4Y2SA90_ARAVE|nr:hypothetical protein AVEN_188161-1 [Araneus ventricosus]GBN85159.1 hypothetical protein AVEN_86039-1 [Araneus ventricosus]